MEYALMRFVPEAVELAKPLEQRTAIGVPRDPDRLGVANTEELSDELSLSSPKTVHWP